MSKNFGDAERHIKELFKEGERVHYNDELCTIIKACKPTCPTGEPKTDVYVLLQGETNNYEVKISIKKSNADFLENKISSERAKLILGPNWKSIICNSTLNINDDFNERSLVYKVKSGRTNAGSITLGWKFELVNKLSGNLSGKMLLTPSQILDVYAGTNLPLDKKNSVIDGDVVINSGVANYILAGELDSFQSADNVISSIVSINDYIQSHGDIYFACKALNYRTFESKFDGNRPLSVYVDWNVINGKLTPTLIFDNPLDTKGNEVADKLLDCLNKLNVSSTNDLNDSNLSSLEFVVS